MDFKHFLIAESAAMTDVNQTLGKIPKKHRALFKGYKYVFEPNHTLNGDDDHIGFVDEENKTIKICAPWNYGREYTLLHEIAHGVWKYEVTKKEKKEWKKIVKNTKDKQNQGAEELFAMAYANAYAHRKIQIHTHPKWEKFITKIAH